jgi:hypothetical protein
MAVIPGGFILLARRTADSGIMCKPPLYLKVWVWLLMRANYSDHGGLLPGQLRTSVPEICRAAEYRSGNRVERPTQKQVRGVLAYLKSPNGKNRGGAMIRVDPEQNGVLVSVENYVYYQNPANYSAVPEKEAPARMDESGGLFDGTARGGEVPGERALLSAFAGAAGLRFADAASRDNYYAAYARAARALIGMAGGDVSRACRAAADLAEYYKARGKTNFNPGWLPSDYRQWDEERLKYEQKLP